VALHELHVAPVSVAVANQATRRQKRCSSARRGVLEPSTKRRTPATWW